MEIPNLTKERIKNYLAEDKRFDGRKLLEYREIEIETNVSKNAEGSCKVKLGDTEVIAGVKIDLAEPYTDKEEEGTMATIVELLPLSSPDFESGPPSIGAVEIARIVDRGIRESGFIDFKKLCIKKEEKVYSVMIDIYSLNNAGNLIDAACLASVIALKTARMPKYDSKKEKIEYGEWTNKGMPLSEQIPLTITFYKVGKKIIVDPVKEEEDSSDARISVALTNNGKEILINALQKGKEETFSEEEIEKIMGSAVEKFKELENKVGKLIKKD